MYLALAFPLGLAYFVGFTVGVSMGVALLVTLVGVALLLPTVAGATLAAGVEVRLARTPSASRRPRRRSLGRSGNTGCSVDAVDPDGDTPSYRRAGDVSGDDQSLLTEFYGDGERTVRVV